MDSTPTPVPAADTPIEITVLIPCYRSARMLEQVHQRVSQVLAGMGTAYELLLVEDCGGDNTWAVIQQLAQRHPEVRGLRMARNFGQHNALLAGIRAARGRWIVTMDDDLQNPPEEIPALYAHALTGMDVVYGTPQRQQHGLLRNLASRATKMVLQGAMGAEIATQISAFRIFRTSIRQAFSDYRGPTVNIDVLLTWGAVRYAALPVRQDARQEGVSGYTFYRLVQHSLNMVTGFSVLPLQAASLLGFGFSLFGVLILVYVLGRYLVHGSPVPGFPFLASVIAIFSGIQLFALGIMGEYLARMHLRSMGRPTFVVAEEVGS